jgi:NADPH:quinone reductase-like Zn-dependent oxidoreductase
MVPPGRRQLLIRTLAVSTDGAAPGDADRGTSAVPRMFPRVRVADVAGVVDAVGPGTTRFARGDRVFGQLVLPPGPFGPQAEQLVVSEDAPLAHIPPGLDPTVAATLPTAAATALDLVDSLEPPLAEKIVLIVGGADCVGVFATQFAANAGAHVITQVHPTAAAQMRAYGAAEIVDGSFVNLMNTVSTAHADGIDILIDLASDTATFDDLALLLVRPWGTAVTTRNVADPFALAAERVVGMNHTPKISGQLLRRVGEAIVDRRVFPPPVAGLQLETAA